MPRNLEFDVDVARVNIMRQFWINGYEGTSLSDLERATSIVRTSLYNTFGKKPEMFLDSLKLYHETIETQLDQALQGGGSATLAAVIAHMIDEPPTASGQPPGCLMVNAATQSASLDARHLQAVRDYRHMLVDKARHILDQDRKSGQLDRDVDPESAAEFLICTVWGALAAQCLGEKRIPTASCAEALRKSIQGWIVA